MGSTKIETPAPPAAPTVAQSMADYVANYPKLWQMQMEYAPQEAALQVALAQQYAQPMGEALKTAQEAMYPQETAITNEAAQQALEGMQTGMPDWAKQQYLDTLRANIGTNAGSGIGADYISRNLLEQEKSWKDYYTNLGLSIAGKQPIYTAQPVGYTNQMASYTPQGVLDYNARNYGSYANLFGNMYNTNAQMAQSRMGMLGAGIGAVGTIGGSMFGQGGMFGRTPTTYNFF